MSEEAPPPGKAIRAFIALPLPESLQAAVTETIHRLQETVRDVRWVRGEGVHLTLRFLGWTKAETLALLEAPLRAAAARCPPAEMAARGLGTFPERGSPRVLWLGLGVPPAVLALQDACERAAVAAGFAREERAFHPHLTLGRWKQRARRPALPEVDLGTGRLDRLVLFRSRPGPSGSLYTPLATFALAGRAEAVR